MAAAPGIGFIVAMVESVLGMYSPCAWLTGQQRKSSPKSNVHSSFSMVRSPVPVKRTRHATQPVKLVISRTAPGP